MNDSGTFKYWFEGTPDGRPQIVANESGTFKYWFEGTPDGIVYPASGGGGSLIKSVNTIAIASIKSINGIAIASVKSANTITNV